MKWNNFSKKYYQDLGYKFTKLGEEFEVFAYDLQKGSGAIVEVVCDFCGEKFYPTYHNFSRRKEGMHCCRKCFTLAAKQTSLKKYGVEHYAKTEDCKKRKVKNMIEKYGVENPSQLDFVKDKKKLTNLSKFNAEWFVQSEQFKNNNLKAYGVKNPMQNYNIREKAAKSITKNKKYPVSKEELKFVSLLKDIFGDENCLTGKYCRRYILDCLLLYKDFKIDVEYDGLYWHMLKKESDLKRDNYLIENNYKVLRFVSKGSMPSKDIIIDAVNELILKDKNKIVIEVDI